MLKSCGLASLDDVDKIEPDQYRAYSSKSFGWVADVYEYLLANHPPIQGTIDDRSSIRIFFDDMRGMRSNKAAQELIVARAKYACLFPHRVIFLSDAFTLYTSTENPYYTAPYSFFAQAFILRPLLLAGFAVLAPKRIVYEAGHNAELWGTYYDRQAPSSVEIHASGAGIATLPKGFVEEGAASGGQLFRTPWLRGVDLSSYVKFAQEEEDSFFLFNRAVSHLLSNSDSANESVIGTLDEVSAALRRLDLVFRQQKRSLDFQGITTAIGSFLTVGAFVAPSEFSTAAAAVGGATVVQALTWLRSRADLKNTLTSDDYWFLWRTSSRPQKSALRYADEVEIITLGEVQYDSSTALSRTSDSVRVEKPRIA
jgi:hypothetical protein